MPCFPLPSIWHNFGGISVVNASSLHTPLLTVCSFLTIEGNDDNEDTKVEDLEEPTQQ